MIKFIKIKDFASVITGGTPSTTKIEYWNGGTIPWLNSGELNQDIIISTKNYITQQGLDNSSSRLMPPDSVLIALTGSTTGVVGYLTFEACANQSVTGILPSNKHIPKYLYYYLKSIRKKIVSEAYGGAQPHISQGYVKDLEIPLPPLPQQQKIVNILDAAAALRQNDKALIAKYDELTQSLFLDMFGDPVSNPKGWDQLALKHFGKISTGNTPSRSDDSNYSTRHIEWIKTDNIKENYLYITQASEYLSEIGLSRARTVEKDAILVACIAGSIDSIGRAALTDRKVSFNQQINAIESNSKVRPKYLYYLIRNCKKHIQNHASNGMKRMLTKGEFEKILMILPPLGLQNQFADRVATIEEQKAIAQASSAKSEELFNSLLQKAFKGELV